MVEVCKIGGPLTVEARKALPGSAFGLPGRRAYPMPDVSHARNAVARASQELKRGTLTRSEHTKIVTKADAIIEECRNNPHNPGNPTSKSLLAAYVAGGTAAVALVSFGLWWMYWRGVPPIKIGEAPPPPEGYETIACEQYKGRDLCVLRKTGGAFSPYAWSVDGGAANGKFSFKSNALSWGRSFIDELGTQPLPDIPLDADVGEPVAIEEPPDEVGEFNVGLTAQGQHMHGLFLQLGPAGCESIAVEDLGTWIAYATAILEGLNLEAWNSAELMDKVWSVAFPPCGDLLSESAVIVAGQPIADAVEAGQAFLSAWNDGGVTISLAPGETPESVLAGLMVGKALEPSGEAVPDPTKVPQFELPVGSIFTSKPGPGGEYKIAVIGETIMHPAAGQATYVWRWYVWKPGVVLELGNAWKTGSEGDPDEALAAAKTTV